MSPEPMVFVFNEETRLFFEWLTRGGFDYLSEMVDNAETHVANGLAALKPGEEPPALLDELVLQLEFVLEDLAKDARKAMCRLEGLPPWELLEAALENVDADDLAEAALRIFGKLPPDEADDDEAADRPE